MPESYLRHPSYDELEPPEPDLSTEPQTALVNGQVWYICSVCEDRIEPSRSGLDASGRCFDCQP